MLCSIKLGQAKPPQRATPNSHDVLIRACLMPFLRRRLLPMTSALLPLTLEQGTGAQHRWWWRPTCRRLIQIQAALTISFSGEIPVIGGNGIPFRNFGGFRTKFVEF